MFPARCIKCARIEKGLCSLCLVNLRVTRGLDLPHVDQCWSAGPYSDWIRDCVLSYKSGRIEHRDGLVEILAQVLKSANFSPDCIVNIPSPVDKVRCRGFDTMGELSSGLAKTLGIRHQPVLKFTRKVQDQVGLNRTERAKNIAAAFTMEQLIQGQIALIDDVITTGATVSAAARTLRIFGAKKIYAISLCRT